MITETKDIFYLVLAFCVLWFTIFVCWLLYYFISIMRDVRGTVGDIRGRIQRFAEALDSLKNKLENSLHVFAAMAEGVKYVTSYLVDRRKSRRLSKKTKTEKEGSEGSAAETEE